MKKIKPTRIAKRGGCLVIGVPNLQETFDILRAGGGLTVQATDGPYVVNEIILVADDRLTEIMHGMGYEEAPPPNKRH